MVLLVAEAGPLRAAIVQGLAAAGLEPSVVAPTDPDLWAAARNHQAVVYLAAASLLDGKARPEPSEERMAEVLGAAEAPGVEVVVPVFPMSDAYASEIQVMKRRGKPYAALRAEPLLEEIAQLVPDGVGALYLPRCGTARYCRAEAVVRAVMAAIETEEQGRVSDIPSEQADAAAVVKLATASTRSPVRVRALWPWLFRLLRPALRWVSRGEERALRALAWLFPELERGRPALPSPSVD